jgi:hypothetical protein
LIDPAGSRLFENADFAIGFPEVSAEAETQILEELNFEVGIGFSEAAEILHRE